MKFLAVGGLGAFLGLVIGAFVGQQLASRSLGEYVVRARELDSEARVCGMPVAIAAMGSAFLGGVGGAFLGMGLAFVLPDPAARNPFAPTNNRIRESDR